jgi:mono/diheme cytochrome c family protein
MRRERSGYRGVAVAALLLGAMWGTNMRSAAGQSPAAPSTASTEDGAALYRAYCASCHGISGAGDGPVAEFLRVPAADLTRIAERRGGVFPTEEVHRIVDGRQRVRTHGTSDMPVWGDTLTPSLAGADQAATQQRIDALVRHLASIQRRLALEQAPDDPAGPPHAQRAE